jgi:hypothetical protein
MMVSGVITRLKKVTFLIVHQHEEGSQSMNKKQQLSSNTKKVTFLTIRSCTEMTLLLVME